MAHTHAGRPVQQGGREKDPEIIKIVSDATKVPPALIEAAAPRWTWFTEDGMPNIRFLHGAGQVLERDHEDGQRAR